MQEKQGISLIVLVITIIVMVILAGAIILTLNNSGIIDNASNAVEQTNLATVKELAQTAWASAYAAGERTEQGLKDAVDKSLLDNQVKTNKFGIKVTKSGVRVVLRGPWVQQGATVTDGKQTLEIGDDINYTATGTEYSGGWKVLGASEYGELLIMSDSSVGRCRLGYSTSATTDVQKLKEAQESWLNAVEKLDSICRPFGNGKGATDARSITVEDVNKITGYNPDVEKYNKGEIDEYGNEVTYTYNTISKTCVYTSANGLNDELTTIHDNGLYYYDGSRIAVSKTTANIKSEYYTYDKNNYFNNSKTLLMLSRDNEKDNAYYWLASPYVHITTAHIYYGVRTLNETVIDAYRLWLSCGEGEYRSQDVRAVVSLQSDVKLTGSSDTGWNII